MNKSVVDVVLRIGVFGTFLGHGILAIQVHPAWLPYLVTVGFSVEEAKMLMPVIGMLDIILAVSILFKPNRYVLYWMIFWAFTTALMRPLSGGSILEFIERSANWAAPLALLFIRRFNK